MFGRGLFFVLLSSLGCGNAVGGDVSGNGGNGVGSGGANGSGGTNGVSLPSSGGDAASSGGTPVIGSNDNTSTGGKVPGCAGEQPVLSVRAADCTDTDADGIVDAFEGKDTARDSDLDGVPDYQDLDSDNDGAPDAKEAGAASCSSPRDTDLDSIPDFIDLDSDSDGIADADEREQGTNPLEMDSDGDGCFDSFHPLAGHCDADSCQSTLFNQASPALRTNVAQARLVLHVDSTLAAALDTVSLKAVVNAQFATGVGPVALTPVDVSPPGAAVISGGRFSSVQPGAALGVAVQMQPGVSNSVVDVQVVDDASAMPVANGQFIVHAALVCSYVG